MRRKITAIIGILILALISSPFWAPAVLDWNLFKQNFEKLAADATGLAISITGEISVQSLVPVLQASVTGIEGDPKPAVEGPRVSADRIELEVDLWPLFSRVLDVRKLHVEGLDIAYRAGSPGGTSAADRKVSSPDQQTEETRTEEEPKRAFPLNDIRLSDVRIEKSQLLYENTDAGQTIRLEQIDLSTALQSLSSPLELAATLIANGEPLELNMKLGTLRSLVDGEGAHLVTKIESDVLRADVDLKAETEPNPGVDGSLEIEAPSARTLANWLGRPLKASEDPGELRLSGEISSTGTLTKLHNLVLSGGDWDLKANGEINFGEEPTAISMNIEGGRIDLDRYLLEPEELSPRPDRSARPKAEKSALDDPLELSILEEFRGELRLALDGLKVNGIEIGETAFRAQLDKGVLQAELGELSLYGGRFIGLVSLDSSAQVPSVEAELAIDRVDLDRLYETSEIEGIIRGRLNGHIDLETKGTTPRGLLEQLTATLLLQLDSQTEIEASDQAISAANIQLLVPGETEPPYLLGRVVYAGELVEFDIESDSFQKVIAGEPFRLDASILSELISLSYQGNVFRTPIFSLDGNLNASIPSAAKLASWIGTELPKDPGPLSLKADFESDGTKGRIIEARIQGDELEADVRGDFDLSGDVSKFNLQAKTGVLRIDRYLPHSGESAEQADAEETPARQEAPPLDQLSSEPLDLSELRALELKAEIDLEGLTLPGAETGRILLKAQTKGGKGNLVIDQLEIADGTLKGALGFDVASAVAGLELNLEGSGLHLDSLPLFAEEKGFDLGHADFAIAAKTAGDSERALVANLTPNLQGRLDRIILDEERTLDDVQLRLSSDSPENDIELDMKGTLRDEKSAASHALQLKIATNPAKDWLSHAPVTISGAAQIGEFDLEAKTKLKSPLNGFDAELEILAEGESLGEVDALLKAGLPAIGPYRVAGRITFGEGQTEVSGLSLELGRSKASGELTVASDQVRPTVTGALNFETLDLIELAGGETEPPDGQQPADDPSQGEKWIFSEDPLPFEALSLVDIPSLNLSIAKLEVTPEIRADKLETEILLKDGNLQLAPLTGVLYGGEMEAEFRASNTPRNSVDLLANITGLDYGALLAAYNVTEKVRGRMDVRLEGKGQGDSLRAIMSSLSGRTDFDAKSGQIDRAMLGVLAFGSGSILGPLLGESDTGELNCIVTTTIFEDGIGDTLVQYFDTSLFAMGGEGIIDLKSETLDLVYNPTSREVSLMRLAVPFRVSGPLLAPNVTPDTGGTLITAAKTAGKIAAFINPLVGLGVLAASEGAKRQDGCETARMIQRGEIDEGGSDGDPGALEQSNPDR